MGFYLSAFEQWDFSFLPSIRRKLTGKQPLILFPGAEIIFAFSWLEYYNQANI